MRRTSRSRPTGKDVEPDLGDARLVRKYVRLDAMLMVQRQFPKRTRGLQVVNAYGNGVVHTVTQNGCHLPSQVRDASVSAVVYDFGYSYDANGNVTAITDADQAGLQSKSLLYDARDRLVSATATQLWGVASYAYDPLDNLRVADQGSRQYRYQYDANNRLTRLTDSTGTPLPGLDFAYQQ